MWPNPQFRTDLVTSNEILKGKLHFFCNIAPDTVRQVFTFEHSSRKGSKPENYRQICLFSIVEFVWTLSNVVMKLGIIHVVFTIKSRFKAKETPWKLGTLSMIYSMHLAKLSGGILMQKRFPAKGWYIYCCCWRNWTV